MLQIRDIDRCHWISSKRAPRRGAAAGGGRAPPPPRGRLPRLTTINAVARQHDRSQALASRHREPAPDHTAYGGLRPNPADNRALQTSKQLALYSETP
jgi:hypothetical protein